MEKELKKTKESMESMSNQINKNRYKDVFERIEFIFFSIIVHVSLLYWGIVHIKEGGIYIWSIGLNFSFLIISIYNLSRVYKRNKLIHFLLKERGIKN